MSLEKIEAREDAAAGRAPSGREERPMSPEQIKHMVSRFLGWRLPDNFRPDCGIHFDPDAAKKLNPRNLRYEPNGTNLFSADQAEAMIRHLIEGLPARHPISSEDDNAGGADTARVGELEAAARQASIDDYRFSKPPPEQAFDGLTFGEEHRYYRQACRTIGAVYESTVKANELTMSVKLPPSLALTGMTAEEARGHEAYLHNKMEEAIVWTIRWHKIKRGEIVL